MVDLSREGMGFEPAVPFAGATPVPAERMGSRANTGPIQPRMGATSPVHHATVDPGVGCVLLELTDAPSRSLARFLLSLCCATQYVFPPLVNYVVIANGAKTIPLRSTMH